MKTIIFLTTQTSATGSIWRIISTLVKKDIKIIGFDVDKKEKIGERFENIPTKNHIVLYNRPDFLKFLKNKEDYRFIVNFRDPRDRLCNSFSWMQQHPHFKGESIDDINARAKLIQDEGIDSWVINHINPQYEDSLVDFVSTIPEEKYCTATYAKLCLDFDSFIKDIASFLEIDLTEAHWKALESERVEKIANNPKWIGAKWEGADIMPGRYKSEINKSTIHMLGVAYNRVLTRMAELDPSFSSLYLENTNKLESGLLLSLSEKELLSADILRDKAFNFEKKGDIKTAELLMAKAYSLRPKGAVIKKKLLEYLGLNK